MQKNVVFNIEVRSQNQKRQMCRGTKEQARIVVEVHKQEVVNKRQNGTQIKKGQAKIYGLTKGVFSDISVIWRTRTRHRK